MKKELLVDKKDIAKEAVSFVFGLLATAIGFFIALYFDNRMEQQSDLETFANIKKSISAEINQNEVTLDSSFYPHLKNVNFNEFSTNASSQQLTNSIFLKYADDDLLVSVQHYIRKCELSNKKKDQLNSFRITDEDEQYTELLEQSLHKTLNETKNSMRDLQSSLKRHSYE